MSRAEVTVLLNALQQGEAQLSQLLDLVYGELQQLADQQMRRERPGHTLQTTALVHEAFLRLTKGSECTWENRRHFFGAAAQAMRRILVEQARRKARQRHGGELQRADISVSEVIVESSQPDFSTLDAALEAFELHAPDKAELVKLRYFAGLSEFEAAKTIGISRATAARWWAYAKAWLYDHIRNSDG